jgi:hypothetical protein
MEQVTSNGSTPAQQVVQPSPVPLSFMVEPVQGMTPPTIALRIFGPTGQSIFFVPADNAKTIAEQITRAAAQARLGLTIVGGSLEKP